MNTHCTLALHSGSSLVWHQAAGLMLVRGQAQPPRSMHAGIPLTTLRFINHYCTAKPHALFVQHFGVVPHSVVILALQCPV